MITAADQILELTALLAGALVEHPEWLSITHKVLPGSVAVVLQTKGSDHGRLLGIGGRNLAAINTLCNLAAKNRKVTARVILESPLSGPFQLSRAWVPNSKWNQEDDLKLAATFNGVMEFVLDDVVSITYDNTSHSTTTFNLRCAPLNPEVMDAIDLLFNAIGKNRGRMCYLDITPVWK